MYHTCSLVILKVLFASSSCAFINVRPGKVPILALIARMLMLLMLFLVSVGKYGRSAR